MYRIVAFLFFYFVIFSLSAKTLRVGSKHKIKSIQLALKKAQDGDTILVSKGLYKEGNILINKSIVFLGENYPILDGDRKFEVISIKANHVVVDGFRIQHSSYATLDDPGGIKIYNSQHIQIKNNILYDNFFGIYVQYGKHVLVKDNRIVAFGKEEQEIGNGIHCWKSDSIQIIGNDISGNRDGIYFEFVSQSVVWRNLVHDNIRYGLHFMFSNDDSYFTNYFKNNGAGVAVMFTKRVTMMNNTFEKNWGDAAYGLLLKELTDSYISGNHFKENTSAVFLDGISRLHMEKNVFEANGWGLKIQANCLENKIEHNNFIGNTFDVSTNGNLTLNEFHENYWDKYEGYDLNKDGIGDVAYHPLSLYSVIVEKNPPTMLLYRSFMVTLLDKSEKLMPSLTPANFIDKKPKMQSFDL
ncbi:MAG: nitrous oxide reductase family maturation protein NosD [Crocinitomicaceae bacterium]